MSDPLTFTSSSARFALPMLFAAQAQKEVFVNEALSRIDGLMHLTIEGEQDIPPSDPAEGQAWIAGSSPSGDWAGRDGEIALRQSGNWLFVTPVAGMIAFDRSAGQFVHYDGQWRRAAAVVQPAGGTTIDSEARAAIGNILLALSAAGLLPSAQI